MESSKTPDSNRIDVKNSGQLSYWSKSLGISEKELKEAVKIAGPNSKAVRKHLAEKRAANKKTKISAQTTRDPEL